MKCSDTNLTHEIDYTYLLSYYLYPNIIDFYLVSEVCVK